MPPENMYDRIKDAILNQKFIDSRDPEKKTYVVRGMDISKDLAYVAYDAYGTLVSRPLSGCSADEYVPTTPAIGPPKSAISFAKLARQNKQAQLEQEAQIDPEAQTIDPLTRGLAKILKPCSELDENLLGD